MAACRPFEEPAGAPAATLRVKFWPKPFEKKRQLPGDAGLQRRPGLECAPGLSGALVIHTLWEVSYFAQFHTGTKRS